MTKLNLPAQICALKFLQKDHSFDKKKKWHALLWYKCPHAPTFSAQDAFIHRSKSISFKCFQIHFPSQVQISLSYFPLSFQWKPISIYKWRNIILTILGCVMQLCILWKHCYVYLLLSFLFKDHTTLGEAEETSEKPKVLSTPRTCANHSLNRAAVAISRVCCCLRLCLLGQRQPKANKIIYRLTTVNLVICNRRIKYLD